MRIVIVIMRPLFLIWLTLTLAFALEISVGPRSERQLSYENYLNKVKGWFNSTAR
jgi:hypothetical protein